MTSLITQAKLDQFTHLTNCFMCNNASFHASETRESLGVHACDIGGDVVVDPDPGPPSLASQHRQDGREKGTKVREETKTLASPSFCRCQTCRATDTSSCKGKRSAVGSF